MGTDKAIRFARLSLTLFEHEGDFEIELDSEEDYAVVSRAFAELGCAVRKAVPYRWTLNVRPPLQLGAPLPA